MDGARDGKGRPQGTRSQRGEAHCHFIARDERRRWLSGLRGGNSHSVGRPVFSPRCSTACAVPAPPVRSCCGPTPALLSTRTPNGLRDGRSGHQSEQPTDPRRSRRQQRLGDDRPRRCLEPDHLDGDQQAGEAADGHAQGVRDCRLGVAVGTKFTFTNSETSQTGYGPGRPAPGATHLGEASVFEGDTDIPCVDYHQCPE